MVVRKREREEEQEMLECLRIRFVSDGRNRFVNDGRNASLHQLHRTDRLLHFTVVAT